MKRLHAAVASSLLVFGLHVAAPLSAHAVCSYHYKSDLIQAAGQNVYVTGRIYSCDGPGHEDILSFRAEWPNNTQINKLYSSGTHKGVVKTSGTDVTLLSGNFYDESSRAINRSFTEPVTIVLNVYADVSGGTDKVVYITWTL